VALAPTQQLSDYSHDGRSCRDFTEASSGPSAAPKSGSASAWDPPTIRLDDGNRNVLPVDAASGPRPGRHRDHLGYPNMNQSQKTRFSCQVCRVNPGSRSALARAQKPFSNPCVMTDNW
jgi:hypothetical protein